VRVQGQPHGSGDGDGTGDGLRAQASTGARDGVGVQPQASGAQPQPSGVKPTTPGPAKAAPVRDAAPATEVREPEAAPETGELTGPLPVVAPTGRRNGRTRAAATSPAEITQTNSLRRTRVIVRRLGPLSVFRFTLLYSFSVMLVVYLSLAILYTVLGALGTLDSIAKTVHSFGGGGAKGFSFDGAWIFSRLFFVGVALVLLWSVIKVIASLIYNLVSNIVGGIEVTLAERR
jgi:hypothetical protein